MNVYACISSCCKWADKQDGTLWRILQGWPDDSWSWYCWKRLFLQSPRFRSKSCQSRKRIFQIVYVIVSWFWCIWRIRALDISRIYGPIVPARASWSVWDQMSASSTYDPRTWKVTGFFYFTSLLLSLSGLIEAKNVATVWTSCISSLPG